MQLQRTIGWAFLVEARPKLIHGSSLVLGTTGIDLRFEEKPGPPAHNQGQSERAGLDQVDRGCGDYGIMGSRRGQAPNPGRVRCFRQVAPWLDFYNNTGPTAASEANHQSAGATNLLAEYN